MNRRPKFPADAFVGTSGYYLRYRPPYPADLLRDLVQRAQARADDSLLDLACGPGRVALTLASSFRSVCAVDLEPEMIAEGRKEAARIGVHNISWNVGLVEDFDAGRETFKLITIGDAFHRLDQEQTLQLAIKWLEPSGSLAILGSFFPLSADISWQHALADIIEKWTGQRVGVRRENSASLDEGIRAIEDLLRRYPLDGVSSFRFLVPHVWTIESIIGYLYSTSYCSKHVLRENATPFENDVRRVLQNCDNTGAFRDALSFGYTFGRKR